MDFPYLKVSKFQKFELIVQDSYKKCSLIMQADIVVAVHAAPFVDFQYCLYMAKRNVTITIFALVLVFKHALYIFKVQEMTFYPLNLA